MPESTVRSNFEDDWYYQSNEPREMIELINDNEICICTDESECEVYGYGFQLMDEEPAFIMDPRNGYTPIMWFADETGDFIEEFDTAQEAVLV